MHGILQRWVSIMQTFSDDKQRVPGKNVDCNVRPSASQYTMQNYAKFILFDDYWFFWQISKFTAKVFFDSDSFIGCSIDNEYNIFGGH